MALGAHMVELLAFWLIAAILFVGIVLVTAVIGWLIEPFMEGEPWTWRRT